MKHHLKYIIAKQLILILMGVLISWNFSCADKKGNNPSFNDSNNTNSKIVPTKLKKKENDYYILTDSRDGEVYTIVKIGEQMWMAENLRYNAKESWLNPNYPSNKYGRLYDGLAAQEICPSGWHLPSDFEWNKLERTLGLSESDNNKIGWRGKHGVKMKSKNEWKDGVGENSSGFNALPAGYYNDESGFDGLGFSTGFWASEENGIAWMRWLGAPLVGVNRYSDDLKKGFATASCRCIKN